MPDSDRVFLELANTVPGIVALTDASGENVFVNQFFVDFAGLPRESLLGSGWMHVVHADDLPAVQERWMRSVQERRPYEAEYRFRRFDGTYRWFLCRGNPRLHEDAIAGWTIVCLDVHERREAEDRAHAAAARLDALLEHVPEGITIASAPHVMIESISRYGLKKLQKAEELVAHIPADRHPEAWQVFDAQGIRQLSAEEMPLTRATQLGEVIENERLTLRLPDSSLLPISCNAGPIRARDGTITGGVIAWRDVTDQQRSEKQRELLIRELHHRAKNLFAVIVSMVKMSARSATSADDLAQVVGGRIGALSRAHALIGASDAGFEVAEFKLLVAAVLDPYRSDESKIDVSGPAFGIPAQAATTLALVFHEWVTNAAKYGCLSVSGGELSVTWRVEGPDLELRWIERGGPRIDSPPSRTGFGSTLFRMTLENQLAGKVVTHWRPEGLQIEARLPLAALQQH